MAQGTCGEKEGDICTWDLMPRIHKALTEHISFEEKYSFPHLGPDERNQHKLEHEALLRLLARTTYEFDCGYGEQLTVLVRKLIKALREHLAKVDELAA